MNEHEPEEAEPVADAAPKPTPPPPQSRRDFLRGAGRHAVKEAVDLGTKVIPGGALARRFLDGGADAGADAPSDGGDKPVPPKPSRNPLRWIAEWRKRVAEKP